MRKVLVILAIVVCSMALLTSCGQDNSPRGVAEAAVKCMAKKDFKGYMELTNATDQQKEGMVQLLEKVGKEGDSKGGLKSYEIVDEQVDEENGKATVTVKVLYDNGEEKNNTMKMVKQDDKWYISAEK